MIFDAELTNKKQFKRDGVCQGEISENIVLNISFTRSKKSDFNLKNTLLILVLLQIYFLKSITFNIQTKFFYYILVTIFILQKT